METQTQSNFETRKQRLVIVLVVLGIGISYLLSFDEGGIPFTPLEALLGVAMGGLYLALALFEERITASGRVPSWPAVFFGLEIALIFGIGWVAGPGALLVALPLISIAVENLPARQRWPVYAGVVLALVLPIGLKYSTWTVALVNLLADSAAVAFVVLFTQIMLNERDSRREAERLNRELLLANEKIAAYTAKELSLAWRIQKSLMPENLPAIPNWDISATLVPARETSGDFYDVIPLPNGSYGILVADVTDKGLGAALFMALSRTILRTYALRHLEDPARVILESNARLLLDAQGGMYVTTFYGVLQPLTGTLKYCNAGHDPPIRLGPGNAGTPDLLVRTGVPLGVFEESEWQGAEMHLDKQDVLVLYSDGVTDAENPQGESYGFERLVSSTRRHSSMGARAMREAMMGALEEFMGAGPRFDDITLMTLVGHPGDGLVGRSGLQRKSG